MNKRTATLFSALIVLLFLLWQGHHNVAHGEEQDIAIYVEWPNEGETLYAAPTSLLYSIPIHGYVESATPLSSDVALKLEVFRAHEVIGTLSQKLQQGHFEFLVTVNPQGSDGDFPSEHLTCGYDCHLPGSFNLVPGALTLKLTLFSPSEQILTATERHIVVDHSTYSSIPIELVLQDNDIPVPAGVTVRGASWLYMWRSRHALAQSGAGGLANLNVEVLSQGSTEYLVEVEPTVVDGVLYEGLDSQRVVLVPGARLEEPVKLTVSATRGAISGHVTPSTVAPGSIWAICREDGRSIQAPVAQDGTFHFEDVPLDRYHLVLDNQRLAAEGYIQTAFSLPVDLTSKVREDVAIQLAAVSPQNFSAHILGANAQALPFAWMTTVEGNRTFSVLPHTSDTFWPAAPDQRTSIILQAPGYYSRAAIINPAASNGASEFSLSLHPETTRLPWGEGALVLPFDSDLEHTPEAIILHRGWLWGAGDADKPLIVRVGGRTLSIRAGHFALEYLPPQRGWMYLFEGEAQLASRNGEQALAVSGGQMVNLLNQETLVAVPYDPVVVRALQQGSSAPLLQRWEPTLSARIRDGMARTGIGIAQIITFVTYILVSISIVAAPVYILYLKAIRSKHQSQ